MLVIDISKLCKLAVHCSISAFKFFLIRKKLFFFFFNSTSGTFLLAATDWGKNKYTL